MRKKKWESVNDKLTVEQWNEKIQKRFEKYNNFPKDSGLICDSCTAPVQDEYHIDFSHRFPMRQTVCSNALCKRVVYRVMEETECQKYCPLILAGAGK